MAHPSTDGLRLYVPRYFDIEETLVGNAHDSGMGHIELNDRWIEMIHVRSSAQEVNEWLSVLFILVDEVRATDGCCDALVLRHDVFEGDVAVMLVWNGSIRRVRTREGLMLADHMHRVGTIDHTVWMLASSIR